MGWSIVACSQRIAKSTEVTGLCHRVSVKELPILTPTSVIRALESDFNDTSPRERSISQDDIQFTQLMNEKIHQNSEGHLKMPLSFKRCPQLPENKQLALVRLKRLKGKLRLHKFISNDRKVMESIPVSEQAISVQDVELGSDELPVQTVLGVKWSVNSDTISFKVTLDEKPATRQGILSKAASVFDSLGFLAPFLLLGKKVIQEMCHFPKS